MRRTMRNTFKTSLLAAAVLSLASAAHAATTASLTLTATISSTDAISCSTTTVHLDGNTPIVGTGTLAAQPVTCTVTSNEAEVTETAYLSTPLTDTNSDTIDSADIGWSPDGEAAYTPFATLVGGAGNGLPGAVITTAIAPTDGSTTGNGSFYLQLTIPGSPIVPPGTYNATMIVAITPTA
jgi:hypothetical protein